MTARIMCLAEIEVDAGQVLAYSELLAEEIRASIEVEPGVLLLNATALKDAPHHIRIMEIYADQAAYESHLKSPHFLKYKTASAAMVTSLRLIDLQPIELAGKPWILTSRRGPSAV